MSKSKFVGRVYFSVLDGDELNLSCLSDSVKIKVDSDRPYYFELSIYEPGDMFDNVINGD